MTTRERPFVRHPARTSSVLAFAACVFAVALVADTALQRRILAVSVAGIITFAAGGLAWRRGRTGIGIAIGIGGAVLVVYALELAVSRPASFVHRIELVPGILGLWILTAAVLPIRLGWERSLVDAGTGFVFLTVLTSGVVRGASLGVLLGAGVLTILAWDTAENAVSVGGQLGRHAPTIRGEVVHGAASSAVAIGAIGLVSLVGELGIEELPFTSLVALLVAGIAIVLAYHR
ncbi:MAG: hypothetical protein V5A36_04800 [Natronomonas sp.]